MKFESQGGIGLNPNAPAWRPQSRASSSSEPERGSSSTSGAARPAAQTAPSSDERDFERLAGEIDNRSWSTRSASPASPADRRLCAALQPPDVSGAGACPAGHPLPSAPEPLMELDQLCRGLIAGAARGESTPADFSWIEALRSRAYFIRPETVLSPLLVMVYGTWQVYSGIDEHDARARFALAELIVAMVELKIMPRAQVLNTLVVLEARNDWQLAMRDVPLADQFMQELRARLDAWVPVWGNP